MYCIHVSDGQSKKLRLELIMHSKQLLPIERLGRPGDAEAFCVALRGLGDNVEVDMVHKL
jgi:hypothetical protein